MTSISRDEKNSLWTLRTTNDSSIVEDTRHYRAIILAAPFHQTDIKLSLPSNSTAVIPQQPYVNLHVTLLSTTSPTANPGYFGLKEGAGVPGMVLTSNEKGRYGGKEPEFNSLSYHGKLTKKEGAEAKGEEKEEYVVKIFSKTEVQDGWLKNVFGEVGWVHRRLVCAYSYRWKVDTNLIFGFLVPSVPSSPAYN